MGDKITNFFECFNAKERVLFGYALAFSFVVYAVLSLTWLDFRAWEVWKQVFLCLGVAVAMGVVMLGFYPFARRFGDGAYAFLFVSLVGLTLLSVGWYYLFSALGFYCLKYFGFPFIYVFVLAVVYGYRNDLKKSGGKQPAKEERGTGKEFCVE